MAKKIFWGSLLAGLIVLLVFGGVRRTMARNLLGGGEAAESGAAKWVAWTGAVQSMDEETLVLVNAEGKALEVSGVPWSYAQEAGFTAQPGDEVTLLGFYESEDRFEAGQMENHTRGQTVRLRDDTGHPAWAGRGHGSGGSGQGGSH